jgi:hypothetical protein
MSQSMHCHAAATSPTHEKLATLLRQFEESGSVSAAASRDKAIRDEALCNAAITRVRGGAERVLWWDSRRVGVFRVYDNTS